MLRTRIVLSTVLLLAVGVLSAAGVLVWSSYQAQLAQAEASGFRLARLLARSAEFAQEAGDDLERAVGDQMVVEATIAAHLVAAAEAAGQPPEAINARLRDIVARTSLSEFWITDERGHAYLRSEPAIDFSFSPDPKEQPQASIFWPLLTGERPSVVQEARVREVDNHVFKYAGVGGVDRPRIVQVGHDAAFLEELRQRVGPGRLVDELIEDGSVLAIGVLDAQLRTLAYRVATGASLPGSLDPNDSALLQRVLMTGQPASYLAGSVLTVIAPTSTSGDRSPGAAMVKLPAEQIQAAVQRQLLLAGLVALVVVALGAVAAIVLSRQVDKLSVGWQGAPTATER
jgi:hypothetical protein